MPILDLPPFALVLLCGPSASGKSVFAARHFPQNQVVSSDACRGMIFDDPHSRLASDEVYGLLHHWLDSRLRHRRFTVVDSTALKPSVRDRLIAIAQRWRAPVHVIALDVPLDECLRRDSLRGEQGERRALGEKILSRHRSQFQGAIREMQNDNRLAKVHVLSSESIDSVTIAIRPAAESHTHFDIIGDVHGCHDELVSLLTRLGYAPDSSGVFGHPDGRIAAFVGDLADRGPDSPAVLKLVCAMIAAERAVLSPGNHDEKLFRLASGQRPRAGNGLSTTIAQLDALPLTERQTLLDDILALLAPSPPYRVLDSGRLVIAHAGLRDSMIGSMSGTVASFALYGDVAGYDHAGRPIRRDWALERPENPTRPLIVYGHTPQERIEFVNDTINLDGGCVYGGALVALRYPERQIVTVPAVRAYAARSDYPPRADLGLKENW